MSKTMIFLVALMALLPPHGSAQAGPSLGDRIRVKQVDGTVLTGTLATLSAETIHLSVDSGRVEILLEGIDVLETSLGQRKNFAKYFSMTIGVTSLLGATIAGITYSPCTGFCIFGSSRGETIVAGWVLGLLAGLPLGAVIGASALEEHWSPATLPASSASGLTIRPVIGSRMGFEASVRFGGH